MSGVTWRRSLHVGRPRLSRGALTPQADLLPAVRGRLRRHLGQALALQKSASALAAAVRPDARRRVVAMASVVAGCVFQSLYYALGLGRGAEVLALAFFGLFLMFLGYLVVRSALIPQEIGVALIVGVAASCVHWLR